MHMEVEHIQAIVVGEMGETHDNLRRPDYLHGIKDQVGSEEVVSMEFVQGFGDDLRQGATFPQPQGQMVCIA